MAKGLWRAQPAAAAAGGGGGGGGGGGWRRSRPNPLGAVSGALLACSARSLIATDFH